MAEHDNDALALLAHELRTPVSTIVAAAAGLERGGEDLPPDKQRTLVRLVASEAKRLARLVEDVVAAAKLDANQLPIEPRLTDVGALAASAAHAARATAPPDRSIAEQSSGDTSAHVDPDRLRQVIDNLIENALRHAAGTVALSTRRANELVRIEVTDDGPGIPEPERVKIFDKFHRLDSPAPGTGLGLWLCHELVTRMNGRIWVTEGSAGGACFVIELPVAPQDRAPHSD